MDFKAATDELMRRGITLQGIAAAFDAAHTTARAWRLDPASGSYRRPPENWRPVLAQLARERGRELEQLADELEKG